MSNVGFMGSTIHRSWGQNDDVDLSIIGNSPLITTLNAFLNTPLLGGMMSNGNNKIIKVQGYKGQLTKEDNGNGQTNYTIQIPLGSSLVTFKANNMYRYSNYRLGKYIAIAANCKTDSIKNLYQQCFK